MCPIPGEFQTLQFHFRTQAKICHSSSSEFILPPRAKEVDLLIQDILKEFRIEGDWVVWLPI